MKNIKQFCLSLLIGLNLAITIIASHVTGESNVSRVDLSEHSSLDLETEQERNQRQQEERESLQEQQQQNRNNFNKRHNDKEEQLKKNHQNELKKFDNTVAPIKALNSLFKGLELDPENNNDSTGDESANKEDTLSTEGLNLSLQTRQALNLSEGQHKIINKQDLLDAHKKVLQAHDKAKADHEALLQKETEQLKRRHEAEKPNLSSALQRFWHDKVGSVVKAARSERVSLERLGLNPDSPALLTPEKVRQNFEKKFKSNPSKELMKSYEHIMEKLDSINKTRRKNALKKLDKPYEFEFGKAIEQGIKALGIQKDRPNPVAGDITEQTSFDNDIINKLQEKAQDPSNARLQLDAKHILKNIAELNEAKATLEALPDPTSALELFGFKDLSDVTPQKLQQQVDKKLKKINESPTTNKSDNQVDKFEQERIDMINSSAELLEKHRARQDFKGTSSLQEQAAQLVLGLESSEKITAMDVEQAYQDKIESLDNPDNNNVSRTDKQIKDEKNALEYARDTLMKSLQKTATKVHTKVIQKLKLTTEAAKTLGIDPKEIKDLTPDKLKEIFNQKKNDASSQDFVQNASKTQETYNKKVAELNKAYQTLANHKVDIGHWGEKLNKDTPYGKIDVAKVLGIDPETATEKQIKERLSKVEKNYRGDNNIAQNQSDKTVQRLQTKIEIMLIKRKVAEQDKQIKQLQQQRDSLTTQVFEKTKIDTQLQTAETTRSLQLKMLETMLNDPKQSKLIPLKERTSLKAYAFKKGFTW